VAIGKIAGPDLCAQGLAVVPVAVPVAAPWGMGSAAIDFADIYSAGIAVVAVRPLEMSVSVHYMFAAANTAAADTELSIADSAAVSPATTAVIA